MMRRIARSITLFASLMLGLAACQPGWSPVGAVQPAQPLLPLSGAAASRLGAAALVVQEQRSTQSFSIVPFNADTGKPVPDAAPAVLGSLVSATFSSDRSEMAYVASLTDDCLTTCLHRMDLRSWKETAKPVQLETGFGAWMMIPTFDAKKSSMAVIMNKQTSTTSVVQQVDLAQGSVTHQKSLPANIMQAAYTPEGNLAVYGIQTDTAGKQSTAYLALLDNADLDVLWEKPLTQILFMAEWSEAVHDDPSLGQYLNPAAAFAPDGSKLYIVAADRPLLVTVDFKKQAVTSAKIQPRTSLLDRLMALTASPVQAKMMNGINKSGVLSQDGRYFYVVGQESKAVKNERGEYEMSLTPLGLQVIDTQDGSLVRTVQTQANQVALDLDGKRLLLTGWREVKSGSIQPWTDVLDIASWQVRQQLGVSIYPSRLLDGSLAWLVVEQNAENTRSVIDIYRPGETKPRSQITSPTYLDWIPIP